MARTASFRQEITLAIAIEPCYRECVNLSENFLIAGGGQATRVRNASTPGRQLSILELPPIPFISLGALDRFLRGLRLSSSTPPWIRTPKLQTLILEFESFGNKRSRAEMTAGQLSGDRPTGHESRTPVCGPVAINRLCQSTVILAASSRKASMHPKICMWGRWQLLLLTQSRPSCRTSVLLRPPSNPATFPAQLPGSPKDIALLRTTRGCGLENRKSLN